MTYNELAQVLETPDKDGNLYVQDWNVDGRIMKLVRVK